MNSYDALCCVCYYRISRIPNSLYLPYVICNVCSKDKINLKFWEDKIQNASKEKV